MNVFKALYCNQYFELAPKGKADQAKFYGTRLLTVAVVINVITLAVLLMIASADFLDWWDDLLKDIFGRRRARQVGMIVALIPFLVVYPIVRFTLGREESYEATIQKFEEQSGADRKRISKKGLIYFLISIGAGLASFVLALLFLT